MTAFGAIAEYAITEYSPNPPGVSIIVASSALALTAAVPTILAGAVIDAPASQFDLTAPANAPSSGTLIDIAFSQLSLAKGVESPSAGGSVDIRGQYTAQHDFSIAGGAITEMPDIYTYRQRVRLALRPPDNDAVAGATIDDAKSDLALTAGTAEVIARSRRVRSITITS